MIREHRHTFDPHIWAFHKVDSKAGKSIDPSIGPQGRVLRNIPSKSRKSRSATGIGIGIGTAIGIGRTVHTLNSESADLYTLTMP